jgi:hypothetical protein
MHGLAIIGGFVFGGQLPTDDLLAPGNGVPPARA